MSNTENDYIIVGAGIAGASLAWELSKIGKVMLIEKEEWLAFHSSGRSAAILIRIYGNKVIQALTADSAEFYQSPPEGFAVKNLVSKRGAVFVGTQEQKQLITEHYENSDSESHGFELVDPQRIKELVPVIDNDRFVVGIYESQALDMDANEIHQSYINGIKMNGGNIKTNCHIKSIRCDDGKWEVDTDCGKFSSNVIINAAGAWGDQVASLAGVKGVGLNALKRTVVFLDPSNHEIDSWPYIGDLSETFYFKPDAGRIFLSPCDEIPVSPGDAKSNDLDVAMAVNVFEISTNMEINSVNSSMAGLRSFVADRTPVVGYDKDCDGFFWYVGQGGYGFQTAPALAECGCSLIKGDGIPERLKKSGITEEALSPNRITLER